MAKRCRTRRETTHLSSHWQPTTVFRPIQVPQPSLQPNRDTLDVSTANPSQFRPSRFSHNFSRVPVHQGGTPQIQPKLTVGTAHDRYEQEADRVASQVVSPVGNATHIKTRQTPPTITQLKRENDPTVQRVAAGDEEKKKAMAKGKIQEAEAKKQELEKKELNAKKEIIDAEKKKEEEEHIQTKAQPGHTPVLTPVIENQINHYDGKGKPLAPEMRRRMEQGFRHDFSQVRIHEDASTNQALQAKAFTHKNNIIFGAKQYRPNTPEGQRLLAHELTHVVQQGAAPRKPHH